MRRTGKVVLTGATGFLGSRLARAFLEAGRPTVVLKRSSSDTWRIDDLLSQLTLLDVDRQGPEAAFAGPGEVEAVIHTATCYGRSGESQATIEDANVVLPLRVLEAAIEAGTDAFLNTDTTLPEGLNAYARSKAKFAASAKRLVSGGGLRFVNVKLEHMFGPQDDDSKFTTRVIRSCLANAESLDLTAGEQRRDFIYVDDVVAGYVILAREAARLPGGFTEYEIGSGEAVSVREFVESVRRFAASRTDLRFGAVPYREGEVMLSCADTTRMKALGWQPAWSLKAGLRETVSWYARHP